MHDLKAHLEAVADLAAGFAAPFGSADWARVAGLWHDLGKNAPDIQTMLLNNTHDRIDHKHAGAIHAMRTFGSELGLPLAFAIVGHHTGVPDHSDLLGVTHLGCPEYNKRLDDILNDPSAVRPSATAVKSLPHRPDGTEAEKRSYEFWVRMLFSCLVDADGLDTEAFRNAHSTAARQAAQASYATVAELLASLNDFLSRMPAGGGTVNEVRRRVLADCRVRAKCGPGVFSLTAPTGAGKTLAGMAFALEHAAAHGKERVIVVIPYTSIIDQNAAVYRRAFGAHNVIDHHASLDPATETPENKLAAENWDAPVVVTTTVQFFESLFANKPSKCRKLHSVCNSVVIFDEVQTLPVGHLLPLVDALKELVANYKVSLVLSTATQPALRYRQSGGACPKALFDGFRKVTEIVGEGPADIDAVFRSLRRVGPIVWPDLAKPPDAEAFWDGLAGQVGALDEVLVVTHLRRDAKALAARLSGSVHLSALMCPRHRLLVLARIKRHLAANRRRRRHGEPVVPLRVVTTQLVEAGVDIDFPVVYRAFGGLDSIAQAAGRCNREGRLEGRLGEVRVFVAPTDPPPGMPTIGRDRAREMIEDNPELNPLDPGRYDEYFRSVYYGQKLDKAGILSHREHCRFATVADEFRMIEDQGQQAVIVRYGRATRRLNQRPAQGSLRRWLRSLQPFAVSIYKDSFDRLVGAGAVEPIADTVYALSPSHGHLYTERFGLDLDGQLGFDPASLIPSD